MRFIKIFLFSVTTLFVFLVAGAAAFIWAADGKKDEVEWVSSIFKKCNETASLNPSEFEVDLMKAVEGDYSVSLLEKYAGVGCVAGDKCQKTDLIAAKSMMSRALPRDFAGAYHIIAEYEKNHGIDVYSETVFMEVKLFDMWRRESEGSNYIALLNKLKDADNRNNEYYLSGHSYGVCDRLTSNFAEVYLESGDFLGYYYIKRRILEDENL